MSTYTDLFLGFTKHPGSNDILKTVDITAVKNAIKNILLSGPFDSPFDPDYGGNIRRLLFENKTPSTIEFTKRKIIFSLSEYEPRVVLDDLYIADDGSEVGINIVIYFHVIGDSTPYNFSFSLNRIR